MSEWDYKGLQRRQLRAIGYLAKLPNYRIKHNKTTVSLEHFGPYGYDYIGSTYNTWREVATYTFGGTSSTR